MHNAVFFRLSPHGESGLKLIEVITNRQCTVSLPAWGEWIEMPWDMVICIVSIVSPRMGRVD